MSCAGVIQLVVTCEMRVVSDEWSLGDGAGEAQFGEGAWPGYSGAVVARRLQSAAAVTSAGKAR